MAVIDLGRTVATVRESLQRQPAGAKLSAQPSPEPPAP